MSDPRTFQPEQYAEMMDHLAALSPHGVTVTNADGSVTVHATATAPALDEPDFGAYLRPDEF